MVPELLAGISHHTHHIIAQLVDLILKRVRIHRPRTAVCQPLTPHAPAGPMVHVKVCASYL